MTKRILVVDDNAETVDLLKMILEKNGYKVLTACNDKECLKKVRESKVELVLLDIMMPGMNGWEVFRKINEKYRNVRVMFLTVVEATENEKELLFKEGLVDYIMKPFDSNELLNRIELYLGE